MKAIRNRSCTDNDTKVGSSTTASMMLNTKITTTLSTAQRDPQYLESQNCSTEGREHNLLTAFKGIGSLTSLFPSILLKKKEPF